MPYAMVASERGGTDVIKRIEIEPPAPGEGQVLVRHAAIGVNFIDIYIRTGAYPWPVESNLVLGCEGAGVVEAVGPGVAGFAKGDRVAYTTPNGAYATHRVIDASLVVPVPDSIDGATAAAVMLKGLTARYLLHDSFSVEPGHDILFHAAAGGVGLIAGQWLAVKGARAIGTAGGAEKCALAREHGYSDVIDYRSEDFVARTKAFHERCRCGCRL